MYIKECKWCKKEIETDKQQGFASHVACCKMNPNFEENKKKLSKLQKGIEKVERLVVKRNCLRCNDEFEIRATSSEIKRNKVRNYCSDKCARARKLSEETKVKISKSLKENGNLYVPNNREKRVYRFICNYCKREGTNTQYKYDQKYHKECWLSISGGIKKGSSRGKSGWYKGYWCDSSYELAYIIYCLENNIKIERNKEGFEYYYENKKHLFYPDFIIDNKFIEIKNYRSDLTDAKLNYFPHEIDIYYKDTIIPYLNYAISKYGKKFTSLYENL